MREKLNDLNGKYIEIVSPLHAFIVLPQRDLQQKSQENIIIIYCHGNFGNICFRKFMIEFCLEFNLGLFLFDYRGYGMSYGKFQPSPKSILEDGTTAYKYVKEKFPNSRIIVWGESLGGYVASNIAEKFPCDGLILLSPLTSIDNITFHHLPWATVYLTSLFIFYRELNIFSTINIHCPVLIIHSDEDVLIPRTSIKKFFNHLNCSKKKLISIKGPHSAPKLNSGSIKSIFNFFEIQRDVEQKKLKYWCEKIFVSCKNNIECFGGFL
jgi:alpha-beta hydrolase superfamily lysophospholipase